MSQTCCKYIFTLVLIGLFYGNKGYNQSIEVPFYDLSKDTLLSKTNEEIYSLYFDNYQNDSLFNFYSKSFLLKAYLEEDTLSLAKGYYMITSKNLETNYNFNDSLIKYSKYLSAIHWVWQGHFNKGTINTNERNFQSALENEIKAYEVAKNYNLEELEILSLVSIGLLKERIGKYKESLHDFILSTNYSTKKINETPFDSISQDDGMIHLNNLHLLSNSYRLNKKLDSASLINKRVQKFQKFKWATTLLNKVRLNAAEVHYDLNEYESALDSAETAIPQFRKENNSKSVAACYYITGMSKIKLNESEKGILDLIKMDSIYNHLGDIYPTVRPGYETLIKHFKKNKNTKQQLYYVEQLLKFDSIAHQNYAYIYENIVNKLEKPELINQQKKLSDQLSETQKRFSWWLYLGIAIVVLLIFEVFRRKQLLAKKEREKRSMEITFQNRIEKILETSNTSFEEKLSEQNKTREKSFIKEIGIAKEVMIEIRTSLEKFEKNKGFTKTELTATSLAKSMNTNANYLGRIVKHYYNKSFRNYINDLRIDYALQKLKRDKSFRKYSVQAMAQEVGFKNAEPFSKTFKQKTGVYPSEFLKEING